MDIITLTELGPKCGKKSRWVLGCMQTLCFEIKHLQTFMIRFLNQCAYTSSIAMMSHQACCHEKWQASM